VEQVDDLAGEALQLVVQIVGEEIDALMGALHAGAHLGQMFRLLVAQLVQLGPQLAQQFLQLLFQRRTPLEMVDDLEEDQKNRREGGRIDEPRGEMLGIGRGDFLREEKIEGRCKEKKIGRHGGGRKKKVEGRKVKGADHGILVAAARWAAVPSGMASGSRARGVAKDFTALGGKVGSAGAGVETEEGEGVEIGHDGVKLVTLGVGKVDKDAVLQAGKAEIDRLKAASQEIVLKILHIVGGLGSGGVKAPRLGLV